MTSLSPSIHRSIARASARRLSWSAIRDVPGRRKLQIALGLVWLIDAALQYQPYMFSRDFVNQVIAPNVSGAPWLVAHPTAWVAHLLIGHTTVYNSLFATLQLLIALTILFRPTVKIGLAVSIVWAIGVWWLAEGIGEVTNGASPVMGAPGAAILYAFLALLLWPHRHRPDPAPSHPAPSHPAQDLLPAEPRSIAERGPLGSLVAKAAWAVLWLSFSQLQLVGINRSPTALYGAVAMMQAGEPGWIGAMDRFLANPLNHHGTEVSLVLALVTAFVGLGVLLPRTVRPAVVVAVLYAAVAWVAQDFGGIFSGQGTDVNTGPLLVLLAIAYWPRHTFGVTTLRDRRAVPRRASGSP